MCACFGNTRSYIPRLIFPFEARCCLRVLRLSCGVFFVHIYAYFCRGFLSRTEQEKPLLSPDRSPPASHQQRGAAALADGVVLDEICVHASMTLAPYLPYHVLRGCRPAFIGAKARPSSRLDPRSPRLKQSNQLAVSTHAVGARTQEPPNFSEARDLISLWRNQLPAFCIVFCVEVLFRASQMRATSHVLYFVEPDFLSTKF